MENELHFAAHQNEYYYAHLWNTNMMHHFSLWCIWISTFHNVVGEKDHSQMQHINDLFFTVKIQ